MSSKPWIRKVLFAVLFFVGFPAVLGMFSSNNVWRANQYFDHGLPSLVVKTVELPLLAATIDGGVPMGADGTTAPGIAELDSIPAVVWADGEVTPIQFTFEVPLDYYSGMYFTSWWSASTASAESIAGSVRINADDTAFSTTLYSLTAGTMPSTASASNEMVTHTMISSAEAVLAAGKLLTFEIAPASAGTGNRELKAVAVHYTSEQ